MRCCQMLLALMLSAGLAQAQVYLQDSSRSWLQQQMLRLQAQKKNCTTMMQQQVR
jgi:hypothetical protein